jgi:ribonuclease P protein component
MVVVVVMVEQAQADAGCGRPAEEVVGEADVSTQHQSPCQEARLSPSDVDPGRPGDPEGPARQGAFPPVSVIGRIQDRTTFQRFRSEARRARAGELWCAALVDDERPARVAYAIGKAVGPAVVRNRLRRRLRAIVRNRAELVSSGSYLIGARPAAAHLTFEELDAMFITLLDHLRPERRG